MCFTPTNDTGSDSSQLSQNVTISISSLPTITYHTSCQTKPKSRDMSSAFALFFIAVLANYIIIKVLPPLDLIENLPEEEKAQLEIGNGKAVAFTFLASAMLTVLYLFKDYILQVIEVQISFGAFMSTFLLIDQILATKICHSG